MAASAPCQDSKPETAPALVATNARAAMGRGDYQAAFDMLDAAVKANRADVELNLALAEWHLVAGDLKAARHHADVAQAAAPKDHRTATCQGHVLYRMGDSEEASGSILSKPSFLEAAIGYEEALALGGPEYENAWWAADARARAKQFPQALAHVARALAARPGDPAALAIEGRYLIEAGRPAEAVPVLARVLDKGPEARVAQDAAVDLVRAHLKAGDVPGLTAAFARVTRKDPFGAAPRVFQLVWEAFRGTKNEDAWGAMLDSAAAADSGDALALYYRAELQARRGAAGAALPLAEAYVAARPGDPEGHVLKADALRRLGRIDDARAALGKAYDLDSTRPSVLSEYRYIVGDLYAARRYREAADVQEIVVHMSRTPADRHDLAVLRLDSGMKDDAERLYRALATDRDLPEPDRARASNALGLLLRSLGRDAEAEKAFRAAIEEHPDGLDAHENLGIHLIRKGRLEEGKRELRFAIERTTDPLNPRKRAAYHLWRAEHPELP
jgi:Flp pilus assembly protein TadD